MKRGGKEGARGGKSSIALVALLAWYGYEIVTLCDLNEENVSLQTVLWEYCAFVTFLHSNLTHKALHLYKKSYINVRHAYVNYPNQII